MTDADNWLLVDFVCPPGVSDFVSAALWSLGVVAVEEIDHPDGSVTLRTSLGEDSSSRALGLAIDYPDVRVVPVEIPRSVADTWRRFVGATHVTDDVWLVPQWCVPPDGRCILVEPFDTFGLGNHPTTVLALREALALCMAGDRVMDLGSGSGVLAVSLARLNGAVVDAHDIAPQARDALDHNARSNDVLPLVSWRSPLGGTDADRYAVVVANILAPVLIELAPVVVMSVRRGGHVVLSGLRVEQMDAVVKTYAGCSVVRTAEQDGWCAAVLRRD